MLKRIFIITFIIAGILQGIRWFELHIIDDWMWIDQAYYVQTGNPLEFDTTTAYGHPGGTVIEGTIAVHEVFRLSYTQSLFIFLTVFNAIVIGGICTTCWALRRDWWWLSAIVGILSLDKLFNAATPPSAVASLLVVFLCVLTWYLYEHKERKQWSILALWSVMAGLLIASRFDIGSISIAVFSLFLLPSYGWRRTGALLGGALAGFIIFDPFMWFMPIEHIGDLIGKIVYHYAEYTPTRLSLSVVGAFSLLACISVGFTLFFLVMRRRFSSPVPRPFLYVLIGMTVGLYTIFLTAEYQAPRYFQPIILIWEVFLPLFIFSLLSQLRKDRMYTRFFTVCVLVGYPALFLVFQLVALGYLHKILR